MSRKKNILLASACIVLGMALAGPAAHAAEEILTAVRSTHQFYLDGEQIQLEAYLINGNNYVKLADVGEALDFNVYWDDAVRIESWCALHRPRLGTGVQPGADAPGHRRAGQSGAA